MYKGNQVLRTILICSRPCWMSTCNITSDNVYCLFIRLNSLKTKYCFSYFKLTSDDLTADRLQFIYV